MIWVVTLLRSKVYCSTTTEATSARYTSTRSPEQRALQPGAEQHCSRGPAGTDQRWRAATAGQVGCHTGGKNNTAAGTCHGGWRPEGGCTDFDVAAELLKRVLKSAGRTGETMERLSRERPSRREIPVADHYRTGPSRAVCVSILTIMDITVNPGPSNIPLHCRIWRTLYSFG